MLLFKADFLQFLYLLRKILRIRPTNQAYIDKLGLKLEKLHKELTWKVT